MRSRSPVRSIARTAVRLLPLIAFCANAPHLGAQSKPRNFTADDFLGVPIWEETIPGVFILEAESTPHSTRWENSAPLGIDGSEATGSGALFWRGPPQGVGHESDQDQIHQGSHIDWLVFRVQSSQSGWFQVRVRNYHLLFDGDNDGWIGLIGQQSAIHRYGSNIERRWNWDVWGESVLRLRKGLNAVYIAGRSPGFGLDRIALFLGGNESIALDLGTPVSPLYTPPIVTQPTIFSDPSTGTRIGDWYAMLWGYLMDAHYPWVYHSTLGWIFITGKDLGNFFFYRWTTGTWNWASLTYLPYHFSFGAQEWTTL